MSQTTLQRISQQIIYHLKMLAYNNFVYKIKALLILTTLFCAHSLKSFAQDLIEDSSAQLSSGSTPQQSFVEKINIISRSGKIFILSDNNQSLDKGDFITLSLKTLGPVARAVVAKKHDNQVGIKVLKIYSLQRWEAIKKGIDVEITKGDDSFLFVQKKKKEDSEDKTEKIESAEDLFNDKGLITDESETFYTDNRIIKPDNIVSAAYNQFKFKEEFVGDTITGNQYNFTWAYQFSDNYWFEGLYGLTLINSYPTDASQTKINNFTARIKYTIKAPLYSYVMPYIGVQTFSVSSPAAGKINLASGGTPTVEQRQRAAAEEETIKKLKKTQLAIGVTILRRLVPGWFVKADLGTDIISIGFAIEF